MGRNNVPEKLKLEAIAYTIAGLHNKDAAAKVKVSPSSVGLWTKDRILWAKARAIYFAAVKDARARKKADPPLSRRAKLLLRDAAEARRVAALPAAGRHGYARKVAETKAAQKIVVVNPQPIHVAVADEDESANLIEALEKLATRFKVTKK